MGVWIKDVPRYRAAVRDTQRPPDASWIFLANRIDRLVKNPQGPGVRVDDPWGSDLHAPRYVPSLGKELLQRALADWPIDFANVPNHETGPKISFLFAFGGTERLQQLVWTIRSIYAMTGVRVECVVVDQSEGSVESQLPEGVVYVRLDSTYTRRGWYKSWAYNIAAKHATGDIVVFHDGDVCVPRDYGRELADAILHRGYDVASIQRFLFYLDSKTTDTLYRKGHVPHDAVPERIYQNWKGGTIALCRSAFEGLGGFDEGFVDWGGEDDEFYDRCGALNHLRYGYVPFIHLWHAPQKGRKQLTNVNTSRVLPARLSIPRATRIEELVRREAGKLDEPTPRIAYKDETEQTKAHA